MFKIDATQGKRAKKRGKRHRAIRAAVAAHRGAQAERGLTRVETVVDREIAAELRARATAANTTLSAYLARILTTSIRG